MSESVSLAEASTPRSSIRTRPLVWLAGATVGVFVTAALAAHAPDRVKLLGLFAIVWGAVVGSGLRWWANECQVAAPRWLLVASCLLLIGGEATIVLESWRLHRTEIQRQIDKDPSAGFLKQAQGKSLQTKAPEEAALRQQLQAELQRVQEVRRYARSLPAYLHRRLKKLGDLPEPLPQLFWAGEILLGSLGGVYVMHLARSTESSPTVPEPPA